MERPQNKHLKPFKPGQSGNPKGRTKGSINFKTVIKQMLEEESIDDKGNSTNNCAQIIDAALGKAKTGDVPSIKFIAERIEGMPTQSIDQTIRTPEPIEINFTLFNKDNKDKKDKIL